MTSRQVKLLVGLLIVFRVVVLLGMIIGLPHGTSYNRFDADAARYHHIASAAETPYRDFQVEVPPIALGAIELIDGATPRATAIRLGWTMLVLDLFVAAVLWVTWGWRATVGYLVLGLPLAFIIYFRLDLISIALAALATALVHRGRERSGGVILADRAAPVIAGAATMESAPLVRRRPSPGDRDVDVVGWLVRAGPGSHLSPRTRLARAELGRQPRGHRLGAHAAGAGDLARGLGPPVGFVAAARRPDDLFLGDLASLLSPPSVRKRVGRPVGCRGASRVLSAALRPVRLLAVPLGSDRVGRRRPGRRAHVLPGRGGHGCARTRAGFRGPGSPPHPAPKCLARRRDGRRHQTLAAQGCWGVRGGDDSAPTRAFPPRTVLDRAL